jgi:hypothetical protein
LTKAQENPLILARSERYPVDVHSIQLCPRRPVGRAVDRALRLGPGGAGIAMKRFGETRKWVERWWLDLSPAAKLAFSYIWDNCDNAGVWDENFELLRFSTKADVNEEQLLDDLGDQVEILPSGRWRLTRFIRIQTGGELKECPPHRHIRQLMEEHGIEEKDALGPNPQLVRQKKERPKTAELPGLFEKKARPRDLLFEALAEAEGIDLGRLTSTARGRLNKAAKEIREVEPTAGPERVKLAARNWKAKYTAPVTAITLASNWSKLTPPPPTQEQVELQASAETEIVQIEAQIRSMQVEAPSGMTVARDGLTDEQMREWDILHKRLEALKRQRKKLA